MDIVISYDVVLGNGTQVVADSQANSDLFWGLKGGANNFGVVTRFVIKAFKIPLISTTTQSFDEDSIEKFIIAAADHTIFNDGAIGAGAVMTVSYNTTARVASASLLGVQEGTETPPSYFSNFTAIPPIYSQHAILSPAAWHANLDTPNQMFR
jgi:FAD/FMN-containing dehydrogenase